MGYLELFLIAVGLSMDAFAVSVCKGLSKGKIRFADALLAGIYFGGFQMLMPLIGYFLGSRFENLITSIDHWVVFVLLGIIGINMIKEAREETECMNCSFAPKEMFPLAVATSIDALAVGVSFAFLKVEIIPAVSFIGVITLLLSTVGVYIGSIFGEKYRAKAEIFGGVVLILMGAKILLEHLGIL